MIRRMPHWAVDSTSEGLDAEDKYTVEFDDEESRGVTTASAPVRVGAPTGF
jgi:hypothetical protein